MSEESRRGLTRTSLIMPPGDEELIKGGTRGAPAYSKVSDSGLNSNRTGGGLMADAKVIGDQGDADTNSEFEPPVERGEGSVPQEEGDQEGAAPIVLGAGDEGSEAGGTISVPDMDPDAGGDARAELGISGRSTNIRLPSFSNDDDAEVLARLEAFRARFANIEFDADHLNEQLQAMVQEATSVRDQIREAVQRVQDKVQQMEASADELQQVAQRGDLESDGDAT